MLAIEFKLNRGPHGRRRKEIEAPSDADTDLTLAYIHYCADIRLISKETRMGAIETASKSHLKSPIISRRKLVGLDFKEVPVSV